LEQQLIPKMEGKVFVFAAQTSNEMIIEHANSKFCCIVAMQVWWDKLVVNAFSGHELLEGV